MYTYTLIYIYIYREREKERDTHASCSSSADGDLAQLPWLHSVRDILQCRVRVLTLSVVCVYIYI